MVINCSVAKDLMPKYVEGSCSEYTKSVIDEHITNCDSCKQVLANFKKHKAADHNEPQKEIKHLKTQRNIFMGISSILLITIILTVIISCKLFIFGFTVPTLTIDVAEFEMKDEKTMAYEFRLIPFNQIMNKTSVTAPDEFGNVYIQVNAVLLSPLNSPYNKTRESAGYDREINGVYLRGKDKNDYKVLWEKK